MQNCSKLFLSKSSNPKMSRTPIDRHWGDGENGYYCEHSLGSNLSDGKGLRTYNIFFFKLESFNFVLGYSQLTML